jgi:phosphohistidine phosphatase
MATWLAEQHGLPERILCSDSARTRETADLLLQTWHGLANTPIPEIKFLAELYHADPHDIVESLRRFHGGRSSLMVIAHNPGISEYATRLCGQPISMPTAAIAIFSGPAAEPDDSDVSSFETLSLRSRWSLAGFTTPKSLTGARK